MNGDSSDIRLTDHPAIDTSPDSPLLHLDPSDRSARPLDAERWVVGCARWAWTHRPRRQAVGLVEKERQL